MNDRAGNGAQRHDETGERLLARPPTPHRRPGRTRAFISYSRLDVYFAEYITARLTLAGIDPWLDFHRLIPGTDWSAEIAQSIKTSGVFILVASPGALRSKY